MSFFIYNHDSFGWLYDYPFYYSAANGCFIKTRAVGSYNGEWINLVSNFNRLFGDSQLCTSIDILSLSDAMFYLITFIF
jgi:hypothetical protein